MTLMKVAHVYSFIYEKEVSGCFIKNCVMVLLVQYLSIIIPGIARAERNVKFVRKDTQPAWL